MLHYEKNFITIFSILILIGLLFPIASTKGETTSFSTSYLPPPCPAIVWEVTPTGENHTIIIPLSANPTYNGSPLPSGTLIGAFNTAGELWGFTTWDSQEGTAITVYGNDGDDVGFEVGEAFNFWIELPNGIVSETIEVVYAEGFIFTHSDTYDHDGISGFDSFAASNGVSTAQPTADFSQVIEGTMVSFFNQSLEAISYEWTFGDGNSSMEESPVYTYGTFGTYEVCLTATNDCFTDVLCQTITLADASGCNDVTDGGMIGDHQIVCPAQPDPAELTNISSPGGSTENLEYIWIYTTDQPDSPTAAWHILPNTNSPTYDPPAISVTTWFRRCVRTSGCPQFTQESNVVQITVNDDCMGNFNCDDFQVNFTSIPVSCHGLSDGILDAHIIGGMTPYLVQWENNMGMSATLNNLSSGIYDVSISDANGCNITTVALVEEPSELQFIEEQIQKCGETEIKIIPSGGTAPYELRWSHDLESNESMTAYQSDDYTLHVVDINDCQLQANLSVEVVSELAINKVQHHATCEQLGQISFEVQGGKAPYVYEWNTPVDEQAIAAGNYQVTIVDSGFCATTLAVQIEENCMQFTKFETRLGEDGEVILHWEVIDELSVGHYFIEQSKDNEHFSTKYVMDSKINTANQIGTYEAVDQPYFGTNYYRIRYLDEMGLATFSPVTSLIYVPKTLPKVLTYPNPFAGVVTMDFLEPLTENNVLTIRNTYGQVLKQIEVKSGLIRVEIDLSIYPDGLYWVNYGQGKSVKVLKES